MALTNNQGVEYSEKLNSMTLFVRSFLEGNLSPKMEALAQKAAEDFCYSYPQNFKSDFLNKLGINDHREAKKFIEKLTSFDGECVFLLRDTYNLFKEYKEKTGKGFGILINRKTLCQTEANYFLFIEMFYDSLLESKNKEEFIEEYRVRFRKLVESNPYFEAKAKEFYEFVNLHRNEDKIIWIDLGFQFTFSLFGYASVELFSQGKIEQEIYLFSVYPWLQKFFKGNYFSEASNLVLDAEINAMKDYINDIKEKSAGALVGFAIGDSLGFPAAGIEKFDVPTLIETNKINSFMSNKKHPYFSHLGAGQYTDNTNLLVLSVNNLIENNGFDLSSYQNSLIQWGKYVLNNKKNERWAGPTALQAVKRLIDGYDHKNSGSRTTASCSSVYRVIPLGLYYRNDIKELIKYSEISGMITHNSTISKTGAIISSLIIANLLNGVNPKNAVKLALSYVKENNENRLLIKNIKKAINFSKTVGVERARKIHGTGSEIYQTLPLAIYYFLKYPNNFEQTILLAANSFRDDNAEERKRIAKFSWEKKILEADGGNSDGIAAITGAFLGAYLGLGKIPEKFLFVENKNKLIDLGYNLGELSC